MLSLFLADNQKLNPVYIKNELGVSLRAIQDANTIKSIATPAQFIEDRNKAIGHLFDKTLPTYDAGTGLQTAAGTGDGPVSLAFLAKYKELAALNLPEDIVKSMAKAHATRVYQEHIELLELQSPDGYKRAYSVASNDHNAVINKNEISDTGISAVAEYKARKRAKKAAKRSAK